MTRPDPRSEIRLVALRSVPGANFWSRRPVTRVDLAVGAYDEISSAEVPGLTEALQRALPGLVEHRCSVGERGGFLTRLRRGTYAPHVVEHVALELQSMAGHDVGYGRARGGDRPGEYTVVFEHRHAQVGRRAALLALDAVQHAFAGTLGSLEAAVRDLRAAAALPDEPAPGGSVLCGITGGGDRAAARRQVMRRTGAAEDAVVDVPPAELLQAGLPYARSRVAVILDASPTDVPAGYREPDRASRLVSVLADGVPRGGVVVVPAREGEVQQAVLEAGREVAVFAIEPDAALRHRAAAHGVAFVREGRIALQAGGESHDGGPLGDDAPAEAQLAAALAQLALRHSVTQPAGG